MAKIIKVTSGTPRIANPFQTSRTSSTNPFRQVNFEGSTLVSAEIFGKKGYELKETNKMKMIASSVAGSMHKFRTSITEPIVQFVNRVGQGISYAWDYAKNTNISDLGAVKAFNNLMNTEIAMPNGIKVLGDSVTEFLNQEIHIPDGMKALGSSISGIMSKEIEIPGIKAIGETISGFGSDVSGRWETVMQVIHRSGEHNVYSDKSVDELRTLLIEAIEKENSSHSEVA